MSIAAPRALHAVLLSAAVVAAAVGCGRDAQTVATGPTPSVASSPTSAPTGPTGTPTRRPPTQTPTPKAGVVRLTAADAGRAITVARGDVILVELSGGPGSFLPPTADDAGVLRTEERGGGYPDTDPATARFTAIGQGVARITSTTDAACLHSEPACMIPQQQFSVTIRVR